MKKIISLFLVTAMLISMSVTAFASDSSAELFGEELELFPIFPYMHDKEENTVSPIFPGFIDCTYGNTVIFPLMHPGYYPVKDYKYVEKLKAKFVPEMGEELIKETGFRKFDVSFLGGYAYCLYIELNDSVATDATDIGGYWELNRKANSKKQIKAMKDVKLEIEPMSISYDKSYSSLFGYLFYLVDNNSVMFNSGSFNVAYDDSHVFKFDYDDEVTFEFGSFSPGLHTSGNTAGANNEGEFEVDVSGQSKLFMEFNTAPNEYICSLNEGADMRFVNFIGNSDGDKLELEPKSGIYNGIKFNRTGTYTYEYDDITPESEPMAYIVTAYTAEDGTEKAKLTPINGCEYDGSEFTFDTNRLVSYVFADRALIA